MLSIMDSLELMEDGEEEEKFLEDEEDEEEDQELEENGEAEDDEMPALHVEETSPTPQQNIRVLNSRNKKTGKKLRWAGKAQYQCPTCEYVTNIKARFTKHVKYHSMPYIKCDFCDFKTPYKWNLDRHLKNHSAEGALTCPLCNYSCDIKQSLTVHIQNHHVNFNESLKNKIQVESDFNLAHFMDGFLSYDGNEAKKSPVTVTPPPKLKQEPDSSASHAGSIVTRPTKRKVLDSDFIDPDEALNELESRNDDLLKFKCSFCSFESTNKQLLTQHLERRHGEMGITRRGFIRSVSLTKDSSNNGFLDDNQLSMRRMPSLIPINKKAKNGNSKSRYDKKDFPPETQNLDEEMGTKEGFLKYFGLRLKTPDDDQENENDKPINFECKYCGVGHSEVQDLIAHFYKCDVANLTLEAKKPKPKRQLLSPRKFLQNRATLDNIEGQEIQPGFGVIEKQMGGGHGFNSVENREITQKVYKCPVKDCTFWASGVARFHNHTLGHEKFKPYQCSICYYRSNWSWDIKKHIKLKSLRDSNHSDGTMIMARDTGEKNYENYERYLTMMKLRFSEKQVTSGAGASFSNGIQVRVKEQRPTVRAPQGVIAKMPKLTKAPHLVEEKKQAMFMPSPPVLKYMKGSAPIQNLQKKETTIVKPRGLQISIKPIPNPTESARKLFKCKKCSFRHADRNTVLQHVRSIHRGQNAGLNGATKGSSDPSNRPPNPVQSNCKYQMSEGVFYCTLCPYGTVSHSQIEKHCKNHFNHSENRMCCPYCSYSVASKSELLEHLRVHGDSDSADASSANHDYSNTISAEETPPRPRGAVKNGAHKKYHCLECPYVTDSKGQFLYHKQFHRPLNSPFKCTHCSYNVSHKHLLHQHLKVHEQGEDEEDQHSAVAQSFYNDEITITPAGMEPSGPAKPQTVLVWRNERPYKMYRCPHCPQVFERYVDLREHEQKHEQKQEQTKVKSFISNNISITPVQVQQKEPSNNATKMSLNFCDECPARFFYLKELKIHKSFHKNNYANKCPICTYSVKHDNSHLLSHMKVHGEEYQAKTKQLLARYPKAKILKRVGSSRDGLSEAQAPVKNPTLLAQALTQKHIKIVPGSNAKGSSLLLSCPKCPSTFHGIEAYTSHMKCHENSVVHNCEFCEFSTNNLRSLRSHESLHSTPEVTWTISDSLDDSFNGGGKGTPSPAVYTKGKTDDDIGEEAFVGNPDFTYPTYMKNGRVKIKRYKCSKCPSAFEKREQYKVHISLHGSDQRYKCKVCDYAVTYYANFIQHLKKHENQPNVSKELLIPQPLSKAAEAGKPPKAASDQFKCKLCPFSTSDKMILSEHVERHGKKIDRNGGMESCYFCNFVASDMEALKQHMKVHFIQQDEVFVDSYMAVEEPKLFMKRKAEDSTEELVFSDDMEYSCKRVKSDQEDKKKGFAIDLSQRLPLNLIETQN